MKQYLPVALLACLVLAGCDGTGVLSAASPVETPAGVSVENPTASPAGARNADDEMFAQMMIENNNQGLELVRLAKNAATRTEMKDLAAAIELTQTAEVETMTGWLRGWGTPVAAKAGEHAHHGGQPATNPEIIAELAKTTGPDFETEFLSLLTGQQHSAVEIARAELDRGGHAAAKELAHRIVQSRTGQIKQLLTLASG